MGQENSGHVPSANAKRISPEEVKQLLMENGRELSDDDCEPGQHDYQYKGLQPSPTASGVFALYVCSKCGDGILE